MRVKIFDNSPWLVQDDVNYWLEENEGEIEIKFIKQSVTHGDADDTYMYLSIFYVEVAEWIN